jgi:hypothetical protein
VYQQTRALIDKPEYASIASDITAVRLSPCDQLFNTLLRKAHVALQLSIREGFEIKVSEAIQKGMQPVCQEVTLISNKSFYILILSLAQAYRLWPSKQEVSYIVCFFVAFIEYLFHNSML